MIVWAFKNCHLLPRSLVKEKGTTMIVVLWVRSKNGNYCLRLLAMSILCLSSFSFIKISLLTASAMCLLRGCFKQPFKVPCGLAFFSVILLRYHDRGSSPAAIWFLLVEPKFYHCTKRCPFSSIQCLLNHYFQWSIVIYCFHTPSTLHQILPGLLLKTWDAFAPHMLLSPFMFAMFN